MYEVLINFFDKQLLFILKVLSKIFGGNVYLVMVLLIVLFYLALIMNIVGRWGMFRKAGKSGIQSLIPIYNCFAHCKLVGVSQVVAGVYIILSFVCFYGGFPFGNIICMLVYNGLLALNTSVVFSRNIFFAMGLLFLPFIFYPLLMKRNILYSEPNINKK